MFAKGGAVFTSREAVHAQSGRGGLFEGPARNRGACSKMNSQPSALSSRTRENVHKTFANTFANIFTTTGAHQTEFGPVNHAGPA
eukprot:7275322-Alexandrium_andersonii.AAC.1